MGVAWLVFFDIDGVRTATPSQGASRSDCGPPHYCANTSFDVIRETPMAPQPENQVFKDPDFGSRMVRVTHADTLSGSPGLSFPTSSSGEQNEWGRFDPFLGEHGGYRFFVGTSGGGLVFFSMDAATMQTRSLCGHGIGCPAPIKGSFSYTDPHLFFGAFDKSPNVIETFDLSTGRSSTLYDFKKGCPGLPPYVPGYPGTLVNSGDDNKFSAYFGGRQQGSGSSVSFYDRATGHCYWYDTAHGTTGGTGMAPSSVHAGVLAPPAVPALSATAGSLPAGDYYVELTVNTLMDPPYGESTPSPEAHIRLASPGGIAVSPPSVDNPYGLVITGYDVYLGDAPGRETRQSAQQPIQNRYVQNSGLVKGPAPPNTNTAGYDIHEARINRAGDVIRVFCRGCNNSIFFWKPGTTNVSACRGGPGGQGVAGYCGGHNVMGYQHVINHGGPGPGVSLLLRPFSNLFEMRQLIPYAVPATEDSHWSWNNTDPADTAPVCGSFYKSNPRFVSDGTFDVSSNPLLRIEHPWDREIVCAATSGAPTVWRFAHHRSTGAANANARAGSSFGATVIGNVSQDGKFYIFSSDWEWTLGSRRDSPGCPSSGTCRVDSFVVELK